MKRSEFGSRQPPKGIGNKSPAGKPQKGWYSFDATRLPDINGMPVDITTLDIVTATPGNTNPSVVPEPASMCMTAIGFGLLLINRQKQVKMPGKQVGASRVEHDSASFLIVTHVNPTCLSCRSIMAVHWERITIHRLA
jgi:hypothetical protein